MKAVDIFVFLSRPAIGNHHHNRKQDRLNADDTEIGDERPDIVVRSVPSQGTGNLCPLAEWTARDGRTRLDSLWPPFNSDMTNSYDSEVAVSATTDFIAELVRAANEVEKLSPHEVSNMLDRSVNTIRELRQDLGIVPIPGKDALIYIRTVSAGAASAT
ncbi:hypothetical protein ACQZ6F_29420 [Rhizobium sp. A22-96]